MSIRVALIGWWVITTNGHELRGDEGVEGSLKGVEWEINEYYPNVLYTHLKFPRKILNHFITKIKTREIGQLVKCLMFKLEDLRLESQDPCKKTGRGNARL